MDERPVSLDEDLAALAVRAATYAPVHCSDCVAYHGSWPALRLAEAIGGIETDRPIVLPILADLARDGSRDRWLIAGMSDTGLLATVAAALRSAGSRAQVTLVDRCRTPLLLCEEYARPRGIDVKLALADLVEYQPPTPQSVVFAHSVLSHIPAAERGRTMAGMRTWLAPGGCLVLVARIDDEPDREAHAKEAEPTHVQAVIDRARSLGLTDDPTLERLTEWLPRYFARRGERRVTFTNLADLEARLRQHGFGRIEIKAEFKPPDRRLRKYTKAQRRVVAIAWAD